MISFEEFCRKAGGPKTLKNYNAFRAFAFAFHAEDPESGTKSYRVLRTSIGY